MKPIEKRCTTASELRVVPAKDGKPTTIIGYAAVFNSLSSDLGGFRERIRPGAFANAIKSGKDVRALVNHDPNLLLGRVSNGTLRLSEDERGLRFEVDVPDTSAGRDAVISINRGDMSGCSFGFRTVKDEWRTKNGNNERDLIEVDPFDAGPVTYPAYEATSVDVRSVQESIKELRSKQPATENRGNVLGYSSIIDVCRSVLRAARYCFDACQGVIDCETGSYPTCGDDYVEEQCVGGCRNLSDRCGDCIDTMTKIEGTPTPAEIEAAEDCVDQLDDTIEKLAACVAVATEPGYADLVGECQRASAKCQLCIDAFNGITGGAAGAAEDAAEGGTADEDRAGHMTHDNNGPSVNGAGFSNAKTMIADGKVDDGEWSWTAEDEDKILGDNNWTEYARWFLAIDQNADAKTKAAYKYPFGKGGKVYRRAVTAIKGRATAQDAGGIGKAAAELWDLLNPKEAKAFVPSAEQRRRRLRLVATA